MQYYGETIRYKCERCHRNYKTKKHLSRHIHVECNKEPKFNCCYCSFKTKYKATLQNHVNRKHSLY